jgi:uncharacterized protein (DUF983 family)
LRRRCPRCGEGQLFRRWIAAWERCSACNLRYQSNQGDIWMFLIITDRLPIMAGVATIYFGVRSTWLIVVAFTLFLIATMRERQGLALALNYLFEDWKSGTPEPVLHTSPGVTT